MLIGSVALFPFALHSILPLNATGLMDACQSVPITVGLPLAAFEASLCWFSSYFSTIFNEHWLIQGALSECQWIWIFVWSFWFLHKGFQKKFKFFFWMGWSWFGAWFSYCLRYVWAQGWYRDSAAKGPGELTGANLEQDTATWNTFLSVRTACRKYMLTSQAVISPSLERYKARLGKYLVERL